MKSHVLHSEQINNFIKHGYLKLENAFSQDLAAECRESIWDHIGHHLKETPPWPEPVIRVNAMKNRCFIEAAHTPQLVAAYDELTNGNWIPKTSLGSFPIRFPSTKKAIDTGWHVDASFSPESNSNYMQWRINFQTTKRALLLLFLFTDVTQSDAPTLLRVGSHIDVGNILRKYGDEGLTFIELADKINSLPPHEINMAEGKSGTVFLCHPFLIHAAQEHKGSTPRIIAQPSLETKIEFGFNKESLSPVEQAIVLGNKQSKD